MHWTWCLLGQAVAGKCIFLSLTLLLLLLLLFV
jgi:hypothetical protein